MVKDRVRTSVEWVFAYPLNEFKTRSRDHKTSLSARTISATLYDDKMQW